MKTTMITSIIAAALAAPLASAWTINACGHTFSGQGSSTCTTVSCDQGENVDFNDGNPEGPIEFNLYADAQCVDEITHFASDKFGYTLPENLRSFLVLT
ncbi:hypothetical protein ASPVEDRAFT_47109 [Aspergillus versicolor CBS 583.65]|uniref:Uncharacterized protein n=1 Tax=Aspergillus versicolor CBS 583.65 TaxID=1036611 RepID=A0A1L9Q2E4_ASPVE|nr:uncharacterized protein ASPVEDRAFT_47109 [Aspergillus versicolor CBS 583.65]OJJ07933.1 hypothetical protein ASPVEDRAFT_47109 [Aspergillus versicolor CBS 583.65]